MTKRFVTRLNIRSCSTLSALGGRAAALKPGDESAAVTDGEGPQVPYVQYSRYEQAPEYRTTDVLSIIVHILVNEGVCIFHLFMKLN